MYTELINTKMHKKYLITGLVIAVLVTVVMFALIIAGNNGKATVSNNTVEKGSPSEVTQSSETTNTAKTNDKVAIIEKNDANNAGTAINTQTQIKPVVTYSGVFGDTLETSAYIPVVDSGGKCTVNVVNTSTNSLSTVSAMTSPNAKTTDCELLTIPVVNLTPGLYNMTVEYSSNQYSGVSDVVRVGIE